MAEILIENVTKRFGDFVAIDDVSLTVETRSLWCCWGRRAAARRRCCGRLPGWAWPTRGAISIGGRDVTYLPPRERQISMVFQSYAIFPHMKVYDNIAFGLKMSKMEKKEIERRVRRAAELLHIEEMLDRYPNKMSGGQRQRVAVARAIAMEAKVLLMDEPLSNLDALLRLEMRAELKKLLREIGATTIYVTHDQIEALSMGDRIAVMKDGIIQQFDHPNSVYDLPANQFVGSFIGNPPMNFMSGQVQRQNGQVQVHIGDFHLTPEAVMQGELARLDGQRVILGIRAENMETLAEPMADSLPVEVQVVEPLGSQNLLTVEIGRDVVKVATHPTFMVSPGQMVYLRFPADKIRWVDPESEKVLYG
jgi:multiple sugar transport system ATP-binding protein